MNFLFYLGLLLAFPLTTLFGSEPPTQEKEKEVHKLKPMPEEIAKQTQAESIPEENRLKNVPPPMELAKEMAEKIFAAIKANQPNLATNTFFPLEPFKLLKDIKGSEIYHRQLVDWFNADISREHQKIAKNPDIVFGDFKPGRCKWKEIGSEYNKIAYWSCYKSKFFGVSGTKSVEFEVRVMINWGKNWYVTHLGPVPK